MRFPWKYIVVSLVIGLVIGAAGGIHYSHRMAHRWMNQAPERFLKHIDRQVRLTDSQRQQIRALLNADRDKIAAFHQDIRKATQAQIRALLTPEQQPKFDAMIARHEARMKKWRQI